MLVSCSLPAIAEAMTENQDYDKLVDDAWQGMEQAIIALLEINEILYPNDGEMGSFRCPRADVALLSAKVRELSQEVKTMEGAQASRNISPQIPSFLPTH